jgi:outer membrane receptor protein involved in Fe transport
MFINPFNNNTDFINRTIGNPSLEPENTHQVDLSYNTNFLGFTIFSSIYYKRTNGIIEQTIRVDDAGLSVNSYANVGKNNSIGLNLFTSKNISQFTLRLGGNIFTYNADGIINDNALKRSTYEYNIFANGEYSISGEWKADIFSFFRSPRRSLQGDNPSFSIYGMGVRREFKKFSLGITLIEPFNANKIFASNQKGTGFLQTSSYELPFRSIGLNFRYKFGSVDFKERKPKIKNTDLKAGEDQGGSQQMPNQSRQ